MPFVPKEQLPEVPDGQCPPIDAVGMNGRFIRLVAGPEIDEVFCHSHNALGLPPRKNTDPCVWAACSLIIYDENWADGAIARVRDFAQSVGLLKHKTFGAILDITPNSGVGYRGTEESPHVSFWMAADFDPAGSVVDVVSLL